MVGFGIVIEGSMQYQDVRQLSTYHESMNICCHGRVNYLPRIHKYGVVLGMLFSTYESNNKMCVNINYLPGMVSTYALYSFSTSI